MWAIRNYEGETVETTDTLREAKFWIACTHCVATADLEVYKIRAGYYEVAATRTYFVEKF